MTQSAIDVPPPMARFGSGFACAGSATQCLVGLMLLPFARIMTSRPQQFLTLGRPKRCVRDLRLPLTLRKLSRHWKRLSLTSEITVVNAPDCQTEWPIWRPNDGHASFTKPSCVPNPARGRARCQSAATKPQRSNVSVLSIVPRAIDVPGLRRADPCEAQGRPFPRSMLNYAHGEGRKGPGPGRRATRQ